MMELLRDCLSLSASGMLNSSFVEPEMENAGPMREEPAAQKQPMSRARAWCRVGFSFITLFIAAIAIPNFEKAGGGIGLEAVGLSVVAFLVCTIIFIRNPLRYVVAKSITLLLVVAGLFVVVTSLQTFPSRSSYSKVNACITNLKMIEGAKKNWAMEEHKTTDDTPMAGDLFGKDKYIAQTPKCPSGGVYSIGKVGMDPTCSVTGHSF